MPAFPQMDFDNKKENKSKNNKDITENKNDIFNSKIEHMELKKKYY